MTMLASPPHPAFHVYGEPRLLAGANGSAPVDLRLHRAIHGGLPLRRRAWLSAALKDVNLRGRGGAAFPVAIKLDAMRSGSRVSVLVNGSEGEPASRKDRVLMRNAPHLVLDGAMVVARALGTPNISVVIQDGPAYSAVVGALRERRDAFKVTVTRKQHGFVGGEIRAVINGVNGDAPVPGGRRVLPVDKGVNQQPTFASNVETFAHIALLASRGTSEFARVGSTEEPGTTLITLIGDVRYPGVAEVPTGVPLPAFFDADKTGPVLIGGYHGTWVESCDGLVLSRDRLRKAGVPLNAGVIASPFAGTCPIDEIVTVARWLAGESTGQCGPCLFGLPAIADDLARIANGGGTDALQALTRHLDVVSGRGACAHPDGSVQFVRSALGAYRDHFDEHAHHGQCAMGPSAVLPLPGRTG
jgi:NADH:ubiquinone oxidoreductase subunit F (NADH-binding)